MNGGLSSLVQKGDNLCIRRKKSNKQLYYFQETEPRPPDIPMSK